jgi:hypothetical protein
MPRKEAALESKTDSASCHERTNSAYVEVPRRLPTGEKLEGLQAAQASRETGIMLAFALFREFVRGVPD